MDFFDFLGYRAAVFFLVITRVTGLFMLSPFFGSLNIPQTVRIGAAISISMVLFPVVDGAGDAPEYLIAYAGAVVRELFVGWLIGFVAYISFSAVNMAGKVMDMQVGFSIVNVIDPTSGQQIPLIGSFLYNLSLIAFVATNGHHVLLSALANSFRDIPVMGGGVDISLAQLMADFTAGVFVTGVQVAIPVTFSMLLTNVGLGILARTMPQLNIFVVGVPMHIIIGLFMLMVLMPFYVLYLDVLFDGMYGNISTALRTLG